MPLSVFNAGVVLLFLLVFFSGVEPKGPKTCVGNGAKACPPEDTGEFDLKYVLSFMVRKIISSGKERCAHCAVARVMFMKISEFQDIINSFKNQKISRKDLC